MRLRPVVALVAIALVLAVLSATVPRAPVSRLRPIERAAIAREIEQEVKAAYDITRPDLPRRLLGLYADTGRVVTAGGGRVIELAGRDSLLSGFRYLEENVVRNMRDPQFIWDRMDIDVLGRDAAVMTASYHIPHHTPRGEPHVIGGAWTAVFVRKGGRWAIIQEHLSDLPAAPAPMDSSTMRD